MSATRPSTAPGETLIDDSSPELRFGDAEKEAKAEPYQHLQTQRQT